MSKNPMLKSTGRMIARNPDEVAVSGIPAGATVALADPEKKDAHK